MFLQRKVKFPFELDALELLTDELQAKLRPVTRKLSAIEGERLERRRARRKLKAASTSTSAAATTGVSSSTPAPTDGAATSAEPDAMAVDEPRPGDIEDEATARAREKATLDALVDPEVKADTGAAVHGLFELSGKG